MEAPKEEADLVQSQDDYKIAEDKVFHAVEDAEKAIEHAIEDEVDVLFHGLNKRKVPVLERGEKVKKVKHDASDDDEHVHATRGHHYEGPWKETLEEMLWGPLE